MILNLTLAQSPSVERIRRWVESMGDMTPRTSRWLSRGRLLGPAGAFAQKPTVLNSGVYYTRNRMPETRIIPLSN